jgi:hypothetical protein
MDAAIKADGTTDLGRRHLSQRLDFDRVRRRSGRAGQGFGIGEAPWTQDLHAQADEVRDLAWPEGVWPPFVRHTGCGRLTEMDNQPFSLMPSPFVMIAVIAMILALVGVAAWHHAGALQLGALGVGALALTVIAVTLRRRA